MISRPMSTMERQIYCNGHHDRMRGIPRQEAPTTLQKFWLDGWDAADGELYDRALNAYREMQDRLSGWPFLDVQP